jgi:hypothetical protein
MQQPGDVLWMVSDAEARFDPLANERTGPHARLKSSGKGAGFDNTRDLRALFLV